MRKVCILILLLLFIGGNTHLSDSQDAEYSCYEFNIFDQWFTEPVESAYFYWADGFVLKFTSYEWNTISVSPVVVAWEIEKRGYDIRTCLFIIHNHPKPSGFSPQDVAFLRRMRGFGFQGMFLLYTSKGVFILRDDK